MKKHSRKIVLLAIIMIIGVSVWAQGPPPPPAFTDDTEDASSGSSGGGTGRTDTPLDGGLSLLLAAGVAYGAKRKAKKN
jgi:hypothetical protein